MFFFSDYFDVTEEMYREIMNIFLEENTKIVAIQKVKLYLDESLSNIEYRFQAKDKT